MRAIGPLVRLVVLAQLACFLGGMAFLGWLPVANAQSTCPSASIVTPSNCYFADECSKIKCITSDNIHALEVNLELCDAPMMVLMKIYNINTRDSFTANLVTSSSTAVIADSYTTDQGDTVFLNVVFYYTLDSVLGLSVNMVDGGNIVTLMSGAVIAPLSPSDACSCDIYPTPKTPPMILIHVFSLLAGLFSCFYGYRHFKAMLFLVGFVVFAVAAFIASYAELQDQYDGTSLDLICGGIALGAGLFGGFLVLCLYFTGIFLMGAVLGILVVVFFVAISHQSSWLYDHPAFLYAAVAVAALVGGIIAVKVQKLLIVLSTAASGSYGAMIAIDYFSENGRAGNLFESSINSSVHSPTVCWFTYVTLSIWPILFAAGVAVQMRWTGKRWDHTKGTYIIVRDEFELRRPAQGRLLPIAVDNNTGDNASGYHTFDEFNRTYPMGPGGAVAANAWQPLPGQPQPPNYFSYASTYAIPPPVVDPVANPAPMPEYGSPYASGAQNYAPLPSYGDGAAGLVANVAYSPLPVSETPAHYGDMPLMGDAKDGSAGPADYGSLPQGGAGKGESMA